MFKHPEGREGSLGERAKKGVNQEIFRLNFNWIRKVGNQLLSWHGEWGWKEEERRELYGAFE